MVLHIVKTLYQMVKVYLHAPTSCSTSSAQVKNVNHDDLVVLQTKCQTLVRTRNPPPH